MFFREEATKVDSLVKDEKRGSTPTADELTSQRVSRIPQIKPARSKGRAKKTLLIAKVLQISEQEKSVSPPGWNRAALHAHHCCVSQKHPGFVHLENLLVEVHSLQKRVTLWKMKTYLHIAKQLQAFVKNQIAGYPKTFCANPRYPVASEDVNAKENSLGTFL